MNTENTMNRICEQRGTFKAHMIKRENSNYHHKETTEIYEPHQVVRMPGEFTTHRAYFRQENKKRNKLSNKLDFFLNRSINKQHQTHQQLYKNTYIFMANILMGLL